MHSILRFCNSLSHVLNYDICPSWNRWVYRIKHPLVTVALAGIVALLCGLFVNVYGLWLFGGLVLVSAVGAAWPWISMRGVTAHGEFLSSRCRVGGTVSIRLRIRNTWPWPIWGLTLRYGFYGSSSSTAGIALSRLGAWSETEFEWNFHPPHRGVYPSDTPSLESGFPFGLSHSRKVVDFQGQLIVWPSSVSLDSMPDAVELLSREDLLSDRRVGDFGDMSGVRTFRDGDSLRRVHWGQTARHGRLIVTERQAPAMCAIRLFVDTATSSHAESDDSLERTISVAASILESLHRQHAFVELALAGQILSVGSSSRDLKAALDALAKIPLNGTLEVPFALATKQLITIVLTTPSMFSKHHVAGVKWVLVEAAGQKTQPHPRDRAWLEVQASMQLQQALPEKWRRACHAA